MPLLDISLLLGRMIVVLVGDNMSELVAEGDRGQRNASKGENSSDIVEADDTTSDLDPNTPESVLVDVDLAGVCRTLSSCLLLFLEPESAVLVDVALTGVGRLVDVALTGVCRKLSSNFLLSLGPVLADVEVVLDLSQFGVTV